MMTYLLIYIWGVLVTGLFVPNSHQPPKTLKEWAGCAVGIVFWPIVVPSAILQRILG